MGVMIALGIDHQANLAIMQSWLETWWRTRLMLAEYSENPPHDLQTDLYIVDYLGIQKFSRKLITKRREAEPLFLPILYLGKLQELRAMPPEIAEIVDDFIAMPVQGEELTRRIRTLLRTRQLSIENSQNLQISKELRTAMDSTSDAIFMVDSENKVRYSNEVSKQMLDAQPLQIQRNPFDAIFRDIDIQHLVQNAREGIPYRGEVTLKIQPNHKMTALLRVEGLYRDEDSYGAVIVITDITEQKRIQEEERKQREFAQVLRDIALTMVSTLDLQEVFDRLFSNLARVVDYDYANLILVHGRQISIERRVGYTIKELVSPPLKSKVPLDDVDLLKKMRQTKKPVVVDTMIEETDLKHLFNSEMAIRSHVGVPILLRRKVIGFLNIYSKQQRYYSDEDTDRMVALADLTAIAIENARLYEKVQEVANQEARHHLARDLHDSVTQALFSATVMAEAIPRLWRTNPDSAEKFLAELHQLTRGALAETRTLLLELRPEAISQYSISELLHQLAQSVLGRKQINIETNIQPVETLTKAQQRNLYYIAHEAVSNAIKHSKADTVNISLTSQKGIVTLSVCDNGIGFNVSDCLNRGMGLNNMHERAKEANIKLTIRSEPGAGSEVQLEVNTRGNER
ncbi:GAF domain-containing protein [Phototrophicus methaneseepsis]|uniref:GAF domain-containing protein n=1 Tax=Phototrophicus methaneseepsis TaxID=2710758 RepID=A0A7S8IFX3_9CHLR|nr:histidine kinase [Phototrophicus methaneseepsis]QPC84061.1 GAF domain-containing protein [Phototrophicus methaneseepsis]